ncbi:MAG: hypothetical protein LBP25_05290, partial [Tannerellaceae bacterium]|nr:hypothetical protein [Tannerellaceae bacterium]
MNIKMIDCKTGQTAVPRYGSTAVSIYMFTIPRSAKCRVVGKPVRSDIRTPECWNIPTLERQNIGTQEYLHIGTFICR